MPEQPVCDLPPDGENGRHHHHSDDGLVCWEADGCDGDLSTITGCTPAALHTDLGHAWPKRYEPTGALMHAVLRSGDGWTARCTGRRATREFTGALSRQERPCRACLSLLTLPAACLGAPLCREPDGDNLPGPEGTASIQTAAGEHHPTCPRHA